MTRQASLRGRALALALAVALGLASGGVAGESPSIKVPMQDGAMLEAFGKAHASLDDFLAKLERPPAGTSEYGVKVGMEDGPAGGFKVVHPGDGERVEFFWMGDVRRAGDGFIGTIANEPDFIRNVANGQKIHFGRDDIADWIYFENGRMRGNFTACPALRQGAREEMEAWTKRLGISC